MKTSYFMFALALCASSAFGMKVEQRKEEEKSNEGAKNKRVFRCPKAGARYHLNLMKKIEKEKKKTSHVTN